MGQQQGPSEPLLHLLACQCHGRNPWDPPPAPSLVTCDSLALSGGQEMKPSLAPARRSQTRGAETSSSGPLVAIGPTTVCISRRIEEFPSNSNSAAFAVLCSLGTELEGCCQTQSPLCMHQGQVLKQQKPEEQRTAEEASGNLCHQCPAEGSARATEQPCMLSILPRPPRGPQP